MPAAEIGLAITSLRSAVDIVKAMVGLRDAETFRTKSIELQGIILDAYSQAMEAREAQSAQLDRIRALEAEVAQFKAWDTEKNRYELKAVGYGGMAYMLKPEARGTEPPHWLCPNCYGDRKKSFFQASPASALGRRLYVCPACKANIMGDSTPNWLD